MAFRVGSLVTPVSNFDSVINVVVGPYVITVELSNPPKTEDIAVVTEVNSDGDIHVDICTIRVIGASIKDKPVAPIDFMMWFSKSFWREVAPPADIDIDELIKEPIEMVDCYV